jgi:hypothetical protein
VKFRLVSAAVAISVSTFAPVIAKAQAPAMPAAVMTAEDSISADRIRAHVKFLADDLLEGRGPGVRGGDLAAKCIATQFALGGLKPVEITGPISNRWHFSE